MNPRQLARLLLIGPLILAGLMVLGASQGTPPGLPNLERQFLAPPDDARIMMRWWWFGPAVTKPELERETAADEGGRHRRRGGPAGLPRRARRSWRRHSNLPYLSDEFIDALRFTAEKARELGLRFDLTLGSGWPFGGPQVGAAQAAGKLRIERVPVTPAAARVPRPSIRSARLDRGVHRSGGSGDNDAGPAAR